MIIVMRGSHTHSYLIKVNDCRKKIHDGATFQPSRQSPATHPSNIKTA